jgi:hypothetical protein
MAFADTGLRAVIDSGRGPQPGTVVLAEACKAGDLLGYSSGWKRALATVGTAIQAKLVAMRAGIIGEEIPVSKNAVVNGYTGATPGSPVYAAEGTDYGCATQTAPSTSGDCNTIIGEALTATTVLFMLGSRAETTA